MASNASSTARTPGSSRRGSLSREVVAAAGLRIARSEDLSGLTIRKLADELGVTPMAIYRYFANKAELVAGVLDLFVREARVTQHEAEDWQEWLRFTFGAMRSAILETPGVLSELGSVHSLGEASLAILDEVLGVLRGAGFSEEAATEAFFALSGYTLGVVGIEVALHRLRDPEATTEPEEALRLSRARFETQPQSEFPNLVQLAPQLAGMVNQAPFEPGLERLIQSFAQEREEL